MANKMYTIPIVCKYKNEWFLLFRFWDNSQRKYIQKKISRAGGQDLNRIKDLKEREAEFKALRDARETWLKLGWNPLTDPEFKCRPIEASSNDFAKIKTWTIEKALWHALQYKKLAVKSKYDYKKSLLYFIEAAKKQNINFLPVYEIRRTHIKAAFAWLNMEKKLPAKNYNKRLQHIKSLLSELVEWDALEYNPAFGIKDMAEEKTEKFQLITDEEREIIRQYLYIENYRFYIFCLTIYYTGVRPDEILSLRIKDVDLNKQSLHLQPFSNVVKNKKEREVVIHQNLLNYFDAMQLKNYPGDYFIFSQNFRPGQKKVHRQVATQLWNKLIIQQLGISKYLYSLKHLGATDYIKAGAGEENIVDHLGHSSKIITRMYTQEGVKQSRDVISKTKIEF